VTELAYVVGARPTEGRAGAQVRFETFRGDSGTLPVFRLDTALAPLPY
jgi:hypothetical protein